MKTIIRQGALVDNVYKFPIIYVMDGSPDKEKIKAWFLETIKALKVPFENWDWALFPNQNDYLDRYNLEYVITVWDKQDPRTVYIEVFYVTTQE